MGRIMARRKKFKFQIEHESAQGIWGLVVSILVLLVTAVLIFLSVKNHGVVSKYFALIAILANLLALAGFIIALKALYTKDTHHGIPITALVLNGITVVFYLVIYIIGF